MLLLVIVCIEYARKTGVGSIISYGALLTIYLLTFANADLDLVLDYRCLINSACLVLVRVYIIAGFTWAIRPPILTSPP